MPIKKTKYIWFNGKMVPWDKAQIHVLTHALHYGSGVFEGIRCYDTPKGPAVFRLAEHMKRLIESARIYLMDIPYTAEKLTDATNDLLRKIGLKQGYIRPIAFRGYGEMGLCPFNNPVDVAIAAWPWGTYLGDDGIKKGIKVKISSFTRIDANTLPPRAKATGQYINSILAKMEATNCKYDEALLLDNRGMISEGPGENLFMVKDGMLHTPPIHASILPGITRDSVIELAFDMGYDIIEADIDRGQLYTADELFFTGTAAEVTPIREVDGHKIGKPGPVTKSIQKSFFDVCKGGNEDYEHWLDYV